MLKIGITGQAGFVGKHLYNTIGLFPEEFQRIDFQKDFFNDENKLNTFVEKCDVIVHLAAMNRHNDPDVIYQTNVGLVKKLINSLHNTQSKAHVLLSSSTQEEKENLYGKSKKEGRELLINWANNSEGKFTGMVIPNVFGPFGHPNYNSVIATFCHKLAHNDTPTIDVDGDLKLIYVAELISSIILEIRKSVSSDAIIVPHTSEAKVSEILEKLMHFKIQYKGLLV